MMIPQQQRRRRRRALPQRTAERRMIVARGAGGFGFTIAGQRPCVVSAVAAGGPADRAGLRAGDALVAVDGANVARATHASVARLVAAAPGAISLSVALRESPPTDTEDTEPDERARSRRRHPPPRRKPQVMMHHPGCLAAPSTSGVNEIIQNLNRAQVTAGHATRLECRAVVGYLGTIETPQATSAAAPGNVRTAVRKLRQERRPATPVLLSVLPNALLLRRPTGQILAQYQRERIIYAGCGSEADRRYFGLVTSAEVSETEASHSCHVFAVDSRIAEHEVHLRRAREFQIACTRDPVAERCLEFPASAEYVVGVIRGMYSLPPDDCASPALQQISKLAVKGDSPVVGNFSRYNRPIIRIPRDRRPCNYEDGRLDGQHLMANSPQPSNHSEITTTSSNSDSGIGFHNDCRNIADRILVVDFAGQQPPPSRFRHEVPRRPMGLVGCGSFDADGSFLSNTTPVVDGFGGQGRPLNLDEVYLNANDLQPVRHVSPQNEDDNYNYNNIYGNVPSSSRKYNGVVYDQVYTENEGHHHELIPQQLDINLEIDRVSETFNTVEIYEDRIQQPSEYQSNESVENVTVISGGTSKASMDSVSVYSSRSHEEARPSHKKHLQTSLDDMLVLGLRDPPPAHDKDVDNFVHPASIKFKVRKSSKPLNILSKTKHMLAGKDRSKEKEARRRALSASAGDVTDNSSAGAGCTTADPLLAAASEPDLRDTQSEQTSPFRRWTTGGGAGSSYRQHDHNIYNKQMRPDATSETAGRTDGRGRGGGGRGSGRLTPGISAGAIASTSGGDPMTRWSLGLDQLLADPAGVDAFSKFLEKEFAYENIRFWCICEEYRSMTDPVHRAEIAEDIYARHLSDRAVEPVNVDAAVRADVLKKLSEYPPPMDTFLLAQKHIFRVMKFDSYPRFLKSNMHSQCARNQLAGVNYTFQAVEPKLKKSASNASERRRSGGSSLLPWKLRGGSRDRSAEVSTPPIPTSAIALIVPRDSPSSNSSSSGASFAPASIQVTTRAVITAPRSQGTEPSAASNRTVLVATTNSGNVTSALATASSEPQPGTSGSSMSTAFSSSAGASIVKSSTMVSVTCSTHCLTESSLVDVVKSSQAAAGQNILCRVILPDGATSVVNVDPQVTVRRMVDRLMKRRNFSFTAYDVLLKEPVAEGASPVVDLGASSTVVGGQEVVVERRCVVRIDVGGRVVAVRCRPGRRLRHALRPIVLRYGAIIGPRRTVLLNGCIVHPDTSMELLDGARLQITDAEQNGLPIYNPQNRRDDDTDSLSDLAAIKLSDEDIQITTSSGPDSAVPSGSNSIGPSSPTNSSSCPSSTGSSSPSQVNFGITSGALSSAGPSSYNNVIEQTGPNPGMKDGGGTSGLAPRPGLGRSGAAAGNGRVRAALRPGPPLHHHPAEFLENLRETQRQRLQNKNETPTSPDSRVPPPLPPKPGRSATFV